MNLNQRMRMRSCSVNVALTENRCSPRTMYYNNNWLMLSLMQASVAEEIGDMLLDAKTALKQPSKDIQKLKSQKAEAQGLTLFLVKV